MRKVLTTVNTTLALSIIIICVAIFGYLQIEKQKYYNFRDKVNCEKYYDTAKEIWEDYGERLDEFISSNGGSGFESLYRRSEVTTSFYSKKLNTCAVVVYHRISENFVDNIGKGSEQFVDAHAWYVIYDALTNEALYKTEEVEIVGAYTEDDIETNEAEVVRRLKKELSAILQEIK